MPVLAYVVNIRNAAAPDRDGLIQARVCACVGVCGGGLGVKETACRGNSLGEQTAQRGRPVQPSALKTRRRDAPEHAAPAQALASWWLHLERLHPAGGAGGDRCGDLGGG